MNTFYVVLVLAAGYYSYKSCGAPQVPAPAVRTALAPVPSPPPAPSSAEQKAKVDQFVANLMSPDDTVVWAGAQGLGAMGAAAKDAVPDLIRTFKDIPGPAQPVNSRGARFFMIGGNFRSANESFNAPIRDALIAIGAPAAQELAQCLVLSSSKVEFGYCGQALFQLGPAGIEAVPTLISGLSSGDPDIRNASAGILYRIGTPEAKQAIEDYKALHPK